jgi:hypothetical protein
MEHNPAQTRAEGLLHRDFPMRWRRHGSLCFGIRELAIRFSPCSPLKSTQAQRIPSGASRDEKARTMPSHTKVSATLIAASLLTSGFFST